MSILQEIFELRRHGMRQGLETVRALLKALGSPEKRMRKIIVAGTNGKGSTAATLSALLTDLEIRTGLYTSPHLVHVRERFRVNEEDVDERELEDLVTKVLAAADREGLEPTFFEIVTAAAHLFFASREVELSVLEVGLGGRLDATNASPCDLAIITDIALDHQDILGADLVSIAREKAAVIPENGFVLTSTQHPSVLPIIQEIARERGATLFILGEDFDLKESSSGKYAFRFSYHEAKAISLPLFGVHQRRNVALALGALYAARELGLLGEKTWSSPELRRGLARVRWPGRLQVISEKPAILLDGAHNSAGMKVLFESLHRAGFSPHRLHLLIAIKADKAWKELMAEIPPGLASFGVTQIEGLTDMGATGFVAAQELLAEAEKRGLAGRDALWSEADAKAAFAKAKARLTSEDVLLVTGSLYLVGAILSQETTN